MAVGEYVAFAVGRGVERKEAKQGRADLTKLIKPTTW